MPSVVLLQLLTLFFLAVTPDQTLKASTSVNYLPLPGSHQFHLARSRSNSRSAEVCLNFYCLCSKG